MDVGNELWEYATGTKSGVPALIGETYLWARWHATLLLRTGALTPIGAVWSFRLLQSLCLSILLFRYSLRLNCVPDSSPWDGPLVPACFDHAAGILWMLEHCFRYAIDLRFVVGGSTLQDP